MDPIYSKERNRLLLDEVKTVGLFVLSDQSCSRLGGGMCVKRMGPQLVSGLHLFVGGGVRCPVCLVLVTDCG